MITIRTLSAADYAVICEVWRESGVHYQPTGRESPESFAAQMASGLQTVLGAEMDGKLVGVVVVTHDGRKGWINRLGVRAAYQRRGVGRELVRASEALIHEKGLTIAAALVEHHNEASLGLFKSEDFQVHEVYYLTKRDRPDV
jgi:ribosomal protein S18 acetylase RimI-like enzyme